MRHRNTKSEFPARRGECEHLAKSVCGVVSTPILARHGGRTSDRDATSSEAGHVYRRFVAVPADRSSALARCRR